MMEVTAIGELLIDFTPAGTSDKGNERFECNPGGAPANVLAALAKLGVSASLIGKVGADQFGSYLMDTMKENGIGTEGIVRAADCNTTLAFVHLQEDGERSFSFFRNPGADRMIRPDELRFELIDSCRIFHFGSISMTHEPAVSATREALKHAKARGKMISFDPNLRPALWDRLEHAKAMIREGLSYADIVKLSEEELAFLTGSDNLEEGTRRIASEFGTKLLLVTLGGNGSFYRLGERTGVVPGFSVQALDTTGAGDSFLGGVLYGLLKDGRDLSEWGDNELADVLRFANAMAALVVTKRGAIPAMPSVDEVMALVISSSSERYGEPYRPQFHFTPEANWLNDPNGMVFYDGEYHLFYQYHPASSVWGPMHWGHAVSRDLVFWEHFPVALAPDQHGNIFSGSAVVDWEDTSGFFEGGPGLVAIFTHADEYPDSDRPRQRQSIAYSKDKGRTWIMYEGNPVLSDERFTDFRDPKVFWHEDRRRWVMVLAAGDRVLFYCSPNLTDWTYCSEFGIDSGSHEGVWECPDLFELPVDGDASIRKWVLIVSIGDAAGAPEGSRTQYFIGDFDGEIFRSENDPATVLWLDHGRDNYAGVSWSDVPSSDGRRIYIGWMSNWKYAKLTPTYVWRGAMTVPRELTLVLSPQGTRIAQRPVEELKALRKSTMLLSELTVQPGDNPLSEWEFRQCELEAEIELGSATEIGFKLRATEQEATIVGFNIEKQALFIDRIHAGEHRFHDAFACRHEAELIPEGNRIRLRILLDLCSVEVFAGDGRLAMTDLIFPSASGLGMEFYAKDGPVTLISLAVHELESIHAGKYAGMNNGKTLLSRS